MKFLDFYKTKLDCKNEDEVFNYLISNLQESISDWGFFVNWEKIKSNIARIETELNILNSLIGKDNIENKFIDIITEYPKIKN